jgi:hypothetical protein
MRFSSSMGVEAAAQTHLPATQDSKKTIPNSRSCNQQSDPEQYFGQVQAHKDLPEALAICMLQQGTMIKGRQTYPLQDQTTKVVPEAVTIFPDLPATMWTYAVQRRVQEHNKEMTMEANYLSITRKKYDYRANTEKLLRKTCGSTRIAYSTSDDHVEESHYKPGGTVTASLGHWASRILRYGKDPTGCGRWSYICLGKNDKKIAITKV